MPPIGDGINRGIVLWAVITSIIFGEAAARCDQFKPDFFVNENGTWRGGWRPGTVDATKTTGNDQLFL